MRITLKDWKGEEFKKLMRLKAGERMEAAAILLKNEIKVSLSKSSNKGTTPSKPGEPPHKDTGRLRASISHEVDKQKLKAWVGTNLVYGVYLEVGTRHVAARPYFRPAYMTHRPALKALITGK